MGVAGTITPARAIRAWTERKVDLTYNQIENVVAAMLDVDDDHRPALRAKFKHLRKLGFPTGVNVGGQARFVYDLERTAQVLLVFAMMDAFVQPGTATALITAHWPQIRTVVASLVLAEAPDTPASWSPRPRTDVILIEPRSKRHWSARRDDAAGTAGNDAGLPRLQLVSRDDVGERTRPDPVTGISPSATIIDLAGWTTRLGELCIMAGWTTTDRMRVQAERMMGATVG